MSKNRVREANLMAKTRDLNADLAGLYDPMASDISLQDFYREWRDALLWFLAMEDEREKIEKWRRDYNEFRPHSSLEDLTPRQFVDKYKGSLRSQKASFLAGRVFG
jgi:transposase InsO family protein